MLKEMGHALAIDRAANLPVMLYNNPPRTSVNVLPRTLARCMKACENIVGVKDATGKLDRVSEQRMTCGKDFVQLSGEDCACRQLCAREELQHN